MKKFISGIIVSKEEKEEFNFQDWYDANGGDYIVHALFDITNPENITTIMINDNIHSSIEDKIESFIAGIEYSNIEFSHEAKKLWVNINDHRSCYDVEFSDLSEII